MVQKYKNLGQNSIFNELCKHNIKVTEINALSMIVDCPNTLKPTDMLLKNIDVRITGTKKIDAGTFKKDYVVYQIKTLPYDWLVERRYNEFLWLREALDLDFPFTFVPPIPDKELASKSEDVVAKRKNWMQLFLNSIVDHPELKSTLHVQGFLRLNDATSYESFKKQISDSSMKQRNLVERYNKDGISVFDGEKGMKAGDFSTLSTKANCDVLPTYTVFMQELTKYIAATAPSYKKVGDLSHRMVEAVDNLRDISEQLSSAYKELQNSTKKFNESSPFGIAETLEHAYSTSASIFMNWSNNLERRTNVIRDTVVNLVDYSRKELDVAAENIVFRNKLGSDFVDYYKKLHTLKSKLYKSKNVSDWKLEPEVHSHIPTNTLLNDEELAKALILPDKTKSLKNMHIIFGFVNNRVVTEWDQMMNFKTRRFLSTLEEFSTRSHELSDEENNIFSELGNGMRNFAKDIKAPPAYYDEDDARRLHNILTCGK